MSGYLTTLVERALGIVPTLQPRPRSRFEPAGGAGPGIDEVLLDHPAARRDWPSTDAGVPDFPPRGGPATSGQIGRPAVDGAMADAAQLTERAPGPENPRPEPGLPAHPVPAGSIEAAHIEAGSNEAAPVEAGSVEAGSVKGASVKGASAKAASGKAASGKTGSGKTGSGKTGSAKTGFGITGFGTARSGDAGGDARQAVAGPDIATGTDHRVVAGPPPTPDGRTVPVTPTLPVGAAARMPREVTQTVQRSTPLPVTASPGSAGTGDAARSSPVPGNVTVPGSVTAPGSVEPVRSAAVPVAETPGHISGVPVAGQLDRPAAAAVTGVPADRVAGEPSRPGPVRFVSDGTPRAGVDTEDARVVRDADLDVVTFPAGPDEVTPARNRAIRGTVVKPAGEPVRSGTLPVPGDAVERAVRSAVRATGVPVAPAEAPRVTVTIGRVEIHPPPAPAPPPAPKPALGPQPLSLNEYLERRRGGSP